VDGRRGIVTKLYLCNITVMNFQLSSEKNTYPSFDELRANLYRVLAGVHHDIFVLKIVNEVIYSWLGGS
jgi:hypothetical protein